MKKIKTGDLAVILILVFLTAGFFCFRFFQQGEGNTVSVSVEGKVEEYRLDENREINVQNRGITLVIAIEDGSAFVKSSDCPEKVCVNTGKISKKGEFIACAPAKVFVKITGNGGENSHDVVVG